MVRMDNSRSWIVFDSSFEGRVMGVSTLKSEGWMNLVIMEYSRVRAKILVWKIWRGYLNIVHAEDALRRSHLRSTYTFAT